MAVEKARQEPHKSVTCCFEQILEATPYKTAIVPPLTSHLTNNPSKMNKSCRALREKQEQTHKQYFLWTPTHGHTSVSQPARTSSH